MASRARVEEYRNLNRDLVALARRDIDAFIARLDTSDVAAARDALAEFMTSINETYGRPASLVAAQFYDDLRAASPNASGTYRAVLADPPPAAQVAATARWAVDPLNGGAERVSDVSSRAAGAMQRYISQAGRDTIALNSSRDPSPGGWARVPSGATTCAWCLVLASRGPVYGSRETAGDGVHYHDDCDCVPTQVWDGDDLPDGYNPDELYGRYLTARDQADSGDIRQITAQLRITEGLA